MRDRAVSVRQPSAVAENADVWVVVPTYNEAPVIGSVLGGLRPMFPNVVCVDDGSTDGSAAEITAAGARLVRHPINLGAGAAMETGIRFALLDPHASFFVTFDADGQHRPEDAAAMVERLRDEQVDILLGSRFLNNTSQIPRSRRLLLRAARWFEAASTRVSLTDAHCGLRAFGRPFAEQIDFTMRDMAHASELLDLMRRSGLRWAEHPVTIDYTTYSRQKGQRSVNSVNIAVDVWLNHLFGRR